MFFNKKYWLYLSKDEYDLIIHCLIDLKNDLIRQGRYTDAVDDVLIKMLKCKRVGYKKQILCLEDTHFNSEVFCD